MEEDKKIKNRDRVAVVVIHGIGEQSAMGTMSHIVKSFLAYEEANGFISPSQNYFSAPTNFGDSFEVQKWIVKENDCYNAVYPMGHDNAFDRKREPHSIEMHDGVDCNSSKRPLTDFYELYWAPMMKDNKFSHVFPWMSNLILSRNKSAKVNLLTAVLFFFISAVILIPTLAMLGLALLFPDFFAIFDIGDLGYAVPKILATMTFIFLVFLFLWIVGMVFPRISNMIKAITSIFIAAPLGVYSYGIWSLSGMNNATFALFSGLISTFLIFKTTGDFLKKFLADAARYYDPSPTNVENRDLIRQHGVQLLENLTKAKKYDRIVVLSHSLGSVVGYDILRLYWAKHCKYYNLMNFDKSQSKLGADALDHYLKEETRDINEYQKIQSQHFDFLKECDVDNKYDNMPWLVSDFISVGSPLSKMRLFSAEGAENVEWQKIHERTILTNPPQRDYVTNKYVYERPDGSYKLHHGALFAFTRWTNIFFPGDWIGGEISENIGKGTLNRQLNFDRYISVKDGKINKENLFSYWFKKSLSYTPLMHTKYWAMEPERDENEEDRMAKELIRDKYKSDISYTAMDEIYRAMHFNGKH